MIRSFITNRTVITVRFGVFERLIVKRIQGLKCGACLAAGALTMALAGCGGNRGAGGSGGVTNIATVEGQTITRSELQGYAEAKVGPEALAELIDYNLIMADLKSKGLEVTDQEVQAALEQRQSSADPNTARQMERMLKQDGPIKQAMERQARLRLAIEKILTREIKISDAELKTWFDKTKAANYPDKVKIGMLVSSQKPRAEAMLRQLNTKAKTFQQLVTEQSQVKDEVGKSSTMETPLVPVSDMPPVLSSAINKLKPGETSPVLSLNPGNPGMPNAYAIVRLVERQATTFEDAKARLEGDYKMQELARREQKKSAPNMKFEEAEQQVQQQVAQQAMMQGRQPQQLSRRDIWSLMNRSVEQEYINNLRQKGKVEITDPYYTDLSAQYRPAPAPGSIMPAPNGNAPSGGAPSGGGNAAGAAPSAPAKP